MKLQGIATRIFGSFVEKNEKYFSIVKDSLPKADIRMPFRTYMSILLLMSSIIFLVALVLTYFVLGIFGRPLLIRIAYSLFGAMSVTIVEFVFLVYYPIQKASGRRRSIETNLPFVITHMGAFSESGIPPYVMFKLISEFEEYGEVSKEMKKIVRNIDNFGLDPMTAIREVAARTPSESLKQLLLGFVTTTESGGNIKLYLKEVGQQTMFEWRQKREKFIRLLDAFAEFYTGILIAAPLFLIALLSVMAMINPNIGGWNILTLTKLSTYLVVPAINLGFLAFLKTIEVEM